MDNARDDGGPAFPANTLDVPFAEASHPRYLGMSLRDYFAAKAMHQILTGARMPTKEDRAKYLPMLAEAAYEIADAMLVERA